MCACACSTKVVVSCNPAKPRLRAQVTLLYLEVPSRQRAVCVTCEENHKHKGCVLSGDLKPHMAPAGPNWVSIGNHFRSKAELQKLYGPYINVCLHLTYYYCVGVSLTSTILRRSWT